MSDFFVADGNGQIVVEAEHANRTAGGLVVWETVEDPAVSNGQYLQPSATTWDENLSAKISFRVLLTARTSYKFLARVNTSGLSLIHI